MADWPGWSEPMKTVTIKILDGEYQVPGRTARLEEVYFTNDRADAMATALLIHGKDITIKIKRIEEV